LITPVRIAAAAAIAALTGLSQVSATEPAGLEFEAFIELEAGDATYVDDADFVVEFTKVLEDNRCPINVQCVWAGNARILVTISELPDGAPPIAVELDSAFNMARTAILENGIAISLVAIGPPRIAGPSAGITVSGPYTATLRIFAPATAE
jgi:hypothetical protein